MVATHAVLADDLGIDFDLTGLFVEDQSNPRTLLGHLLGSHVQPARRQVRDDRTVVLTGDDEIAGDPVANTGELRPALSSRLARDTHPR